MKARSGRLGDFVMTLLLLLMGGGLLYCSHPSMKENREIIGEAVKLWFVCAGLGTVLILSVVLRWVGGCRRKREHFIDFPSEEGSVGISTRAIQDFIERVGREFAAIKSIESRLDQGREGLDIAIHVKVQSGNKIPELSQVLRRRVRESVRESLGIEEIHNITIRVQEIVGEPVRKTDPVEDDL